MTTYLKRTNADGISSYNPEGTRMFIPGDPSNMDYARMILEISEGTSTIDEVDDT
jgi:hypothetical protein